MAVVIKVKGTGRSPGGLSEEGNKNCNFRTNVHHERLSVIFNRLNIKFNYAMLHQPVAISSHSKLDPVNCSQLGLAHRYPLSAASMLHMCTICDDLKFLEIVCSSPLYPSTIY